MIFNFTEIGRALENEDLILSERIELANNLFTSLEVPSKHKEAFVIIWLLKLGNEEGDINWKYLHAWLSSFQFKELTRNEISNHEINTIMEVSICSAHIFDLFNFIPHTYTWGIGTWHKHHSCIQGKTHPFKACE